jgi:uncharacterized protein
MKMIRSILVVILLIFTSGLIAQEKKDRPSDRPQLMDDYEMKTYYLVFLKKGPHRDQDSVTRAKIQEQHLAHLMKQANAGKMNLAGPLLDDSDILGICIYNVATKEEAELLAKEDPAVKAGRLIVEIHPFYSAKGSVLK